jgi:hypothetical protein
VLLTVQKWFVCPWFLEQWGRLANERAKGTWTATEKEYHVTLCKLNTPVQGTVVVPQYCDNSSNMLMTITAHEEFNCDDGAKDMQYLLDLLYNTVRRSPSPMDR